MNILAAVLAISFLQFFEARNQVANFVIDPPPEGTSVKPELPDFTVTEACPGCDGKGDLVLVEPNYGQATGRIGKARKERRKCPICKGKGKIQTLMNPSEILLQVAADRNAFESEHQGKGEIAVGEAFVPHETYEGLSKEKRKLVDNAFGRPCKKCNWTGLEACRKCKGKGVVQCTNSDCKGGWIVTKNTTSTSVTRSGSSSVSVKTSSCCGSKSSRGSRSSSVSAPRRTTRSDTQITVSPCPVCGGATITPCPECGGRRANPCKKCMGLGIKRKGSL